MGLCLWDFTPALWGLRLGGAMPWRGVEEVDTEAGRHLRAQDLPGPLGEASSPAESAAPKFCFLSLPELWDDCV